jgi:hypothetical protein
MFLGDNKMFRFGDRVRIISYDNGEYRQMPPFIGVTGEIHLISGDDDSIFPLFRIEKGEKIVLEQE